MPVEAKPLFRPDVLRSHLSGFQLPALDSAKLTHWAGEIASGRLDRFGEQEILPHFLSDFFVGLLGYTGPAGHRPSVAHRSRLPCRDRIRRLATMRYNVPRRVSEWLAV